MGKMIFLMVILCISLWLFVCSASPMNNDEEEDTTEITTVESIRQYNKPYTQ